MALKNREILSLDETITVFEYKTATAFKVALLLGAVAASADARSIELMERFSHLAGIGYQIKDDIEDFKNENGDLEIHKPSVLVSLLVEKLTTDDRILFQEAWEGNDTVAIQQLVEKYNIIRCAEDLLLDYINESGQCLADFQNIGLKMALHEILGNMFKAYI